VRGAEQEKEGGCPEKSVSHESTYPNVSNVKEGTRNQAHYHALSVRIAMMMPKLAMSVSADVPP
jgi:hypothetical protein